MPTVVLVRHGRTTANASGTLAGRLPGVELDDVGRTQVGVVSERLREVAITELLTSPQQRCRQTAAVIAAGRTEPLRARVEKQVAECDYGSWQGRPLKELAKEPLWGVVQRQPSAAAFPDGESLRAMQDRAVTAVRSHDARLAAEVGPHAVLVVVSHGDIIKSVLADALGMHLDLFQRLHVDPASATVIRYTDTRPYVLATNSTSGSLAWIATPPPKPRRGSRRAPATDDAPVGGGAGPVPAGS